MSLRSSGRLVLIIAALVLIGGIGGLLAALSTKAAYTAHTQSLISVGPSTDSIELNSGLTYAQSSASTFARLGESTAVLSPVADELPSDYTILRLQQSVTVSSTSSDSILDINATDSSPARAAQIVDLVAAQLSNVASRLPVANKKVEVAITQVGRAETPSTPSSPDALIDVLVGATLGLVAGFGYWAIASQREKPVVHA